MSEHAVLAECLRASLASRSVIDQTLGVLMAEQRCTSAQAFAILRTASQNLLAHSDGHLRIMAAGARVGAGPRPDTAGRLAACLPLCGIRCIIPSSPHDAGRVLQWSRDVATASFLCCWSELWMPTT
jgi:ANTAR domain